MGLKYAITLLSLVLEPDHGNYFCITKNICEWDDKQIEKKKLQVKEWPSVDIFFFDQRLISLSNIVKSIC